MFTAYSTQGQLKPRLILAEGFWDGLIQAAAYLGRESVRVNALKRCPCPCKIRNVWSAPEEKQILLICSELEIPGQLDVCVNSASVSSPILILNLRLL